MIVDLTLEVLRPGAKYILSNLDINSMEWNDPRPKPTEEEFVNCLLSLPHALKEMEEHEKQLQLQTEEQK